MTDTELVALEHYNTNSKSVRVGDGTTYTFVPQHNVSLVWVKPEHVNELLGMRAKMCCGKSRPLCFRASQTNINIWETGDRW